MTNGEYMREKLRAFGVTDAMLIDSGVDLTAEYTANDVVVAKGMIGVLEDIALAPKMTNINEQGFSVSWDTTQLGKYYYYLCRKYGVEPNCDVLASVDIPMIKDVTNQW